MKKTILFMLIFVFIVLVGIFFISDKTAKKNKNNRLPTGVSIKTTSAPTLTRFRQVKETKALFVPYWILDDDFYTTDFDRFIYFGVTADKEGINEQEEGYGNLERFVRICQKECYLTLRLTDNNINSFILENRKIRGKIISEITKITSEKKLTGLVLDIEISYLINNNLVTQINNFVQDLYTEQKKYYKKFAVVLYGDTFYRRRPYDVKFLAANSDEVMVMAYDFHKSTGEPGPNFPFMLKGSREYDFLKMTDDFLKYVSADKLTVIFGMYGYDWQVDEKKRPITQAKALTLKEIRQKFFSGQKTATAGGGYAPKNMICTLENCVVRRDSQVQETEINYVISADTPDDQGIYRIDYHIVWFEDEKSVKVKADYLKEQGIGSIAYWAYGYF